MAINYNPAGYNEGSTTKPSSVDKNVSGEQMQSFFWLRKAVIEARKEQYFMPLATVTNMPAHFGKTMKVHEWIPLLDDRNINDQGIDATGAQISDGNLYGSSRDVGTITGKLPTLTEFGGRVNRVGFQRKTLEGSIHKFGFFHEFTQESIDFDSDDQLDQHLARELMNGATQLTEAALQMDLLAAAGTIVYTGAATSKATITGEGTTKSLVTYADLMRLDQILTDNRTPKQTTIITGSRNIDTRVIPNARVMYVSSALVPHLKTMKDTFDNKALIEVQHYAAAGTVLNGEIGTIDAFRIIQVPEMLHWAGVGAAATGANPGYRATANKYDVYPMLVVGEDSFTTIGFQTNGQVLKFQVTTKMPGQATADRNDPYGEIGFSSIKWYYGILVKRPERIAQILTVAPM